MRITHQPSSREESQSSSARPNESPTRCGSCGLLVSAPHGTDADCIAALHDAIDVMRPPLRRTA